MHSTADGFAIGAPVRSASGLSMMSSRPSASASRTDAMPSAARKSPVMSGVTLVRSYVVPSERTAGRSAPGSPRRSNCTAFFSFSSPHTGHRRV
ncbi:hypothetical protein [Fodinicola feengrottensis]|uniref:hypothetical protein n=1 Tax=Fodinicola feengrottensis TaxID=435914 RepID=UPI00244223BA|nr:hypothetical protein [Fodinicola feengrottensis]